MTGQRESAKVAGEWLFKAGRDLQTARHMSALGDDSPYDIVCFHAQQCAEKSLKALLTYLSIDFPKTHDLTELAALLPGEDRAKLPTGDFSELNPYAISSRYPGGWDPETAADAVRAISIAAKTRGFVEKRLS